MDDINKLDTWLATLMSNVEPEGRKRMMRDLVQQLRRTQQKNIKLQRNPDGSGYTPRRVTAHSKKGRIKRQMFTRLRTTKYLRVSSSVNTASVQFVSSVQRIARIHHYGLRDNVSRRGPTVRYAERRLLGINVTLEQNIQLILCDYLIR